MLTLMNLDDALAYQPTELVSRSALFSLSPARVGTSQQESLLSLLVRTSRAHLVSPRLLIKEVFGGVNSAISKPCCTDFFSIDAGTVNGLGRYAEMFVSAMGELTSNQNIRYLTMLPWQGLFPFNGQGLLARYPRWCPACLYQQHLSGQDTIFPLNWYVDVSRICVEHMCHLEDCCPHCGKTQPYLPRYPDLSICEHCHRSLAGVRYRGEMPQFQLWLNDAIGGMIMHQSEPNFAPSVDGFHEFVRERVRAMSAGNQAMFCRAIGFKDQGLKGWLTNGERPSFTQFLALCYGVNVMPVDIFVGGMAMDGSGFRLSPEKIKKRKACSRPSPQRRKELEESLNALLVSEESQSVTMIAANLGVTSSCLRYWFAELCALLSERYKTAIKVRSQIHQAQQGRRVEEVVKMIYMEGRYPSQLQVDYVLSKEGMSLVQPHLLLAYKKALNDV